MDFKEELETRMEQLRSKMGDYAWDFANDYDATETCYLNDLISEFADNSVSCYTSEQEDYYREHSSDCESALSSLYESEDLAKMIKDNGLDYLIARAGVCGWYEEAYCETSRYIDLVIQYWACKYALEHIEEIKNPEEAIENIDTLEENDVRRVNDIIDCCFKFEDEED